MKNAIPISEQLMRVPSDVRPIVAAARRMIKSVAPDATEVAYRSGPPRSASYMWKLVRYTVDGRNVLGIGTFSKYSTIFLYRGRELDDPHGLLKGSGRDARFVTLLSTSDAQRPAIKRLVREAVRLGGAD